MARKKSKTTKASKSRKPAVQKKTKKSQSPIKKKSKISLKCNENVFVSQGVKENQNEVKSINESSIDLKNVPDTNSIVTNKANSSKSQDKKSSEIPVKSNENLAASQNPNNTLGEITQSLSENLTESANDPVKSNESLVVSQIANNTFDEITKSLCESFTESVNDLNYYSVVHKKTTKPNNPKLPVENSKVESQSIDETFGEISSFCETLIDTENVSLKSIESKVISQDPNTTLDEMTTLCESLLDSENVPDSNSVAHKKPKKLESSFEKNFELPVENNKAANVSEFNDQTLDDLSLLSETYTESVTDTSLIIHKTAKKPTPSTENKSKLPLKRKTESVGVSQGTKKALDEINSLCEGLAETPDVPDTAEGSSDDECMDYEECISNFEKTHLQMMETFESDTLNYTNDFNSTFKQQIEYLKEQQKLGRISSENTVSMFASAMKFMNVYNDEMTKAILQAKQSYNKFQRQEEEFVEKYMGVLKEIEELESELE